jgi:hypothetical protein
MTFSSTWKMWGGKMGSHGSERTEQPVCFVGYSASDFAGSAVCLARAAGRAGRCRGLCRYRALLDLQVHVRIPTLTKSAQLSVERPHSRLYQ